MYARLIGNLSSNAAAKSWATSLAVHVAAFSALVVWHGPPGTPPRLNSHFGQSSLLLSTADPNPGGSEASDSLAEPSIVTPETIEIESQPVPLTELVEEVDESALEPQRLTEIKEANDLSLLPPAAALEPIEEPRPNAPQPPPGDDTPASSVPSPGRIGNDHTSDPAFDSNPPILYPSEAVRDAIEGTVLLRIRIGPDGKVIAVELVQSSGSSILDRAAIEGVRKWHGQPGQISGHAIEAAALLPIVFRLH
jgi:protein TonB